MNSMTNTQRKKKGLYIKRSLTLLKAMANQHRLLILYSIKKKEYSVGELEKITQISQSGLSQHLAKLREDGLVKTRRSAQIIFYSLSNHQVKKILDYIFENLTEETAPISSEIREFYTESNKVLPALF